MSSDDTAARRLRLLRRPDGAPAPVQQRCRACRRSRYRVDTQPGFHARMLQPAAARAAEPDAPMRRARSPRCSPRAPPTTRPSRCSTPAACVADVLTFYQERIANEGFLRTATERRSVLELARAIGYELKPGRGRQRATWPSPSRTRPARPGICTVAAGHAGAERAAAGQAAAGLRDQRPSSSRTPSGTRCVPRQTRPADMAILDVERRHSATRSCCWGRAAASGRRRRRVPEPASSADLSGSIRASRSSRSVDALEVGRVYFTEAATGIAGGDLLLFVGKRRQSTATAGAARASRWSPEPTLKRVRVDLEPLPDPARRRRRRAVGVVVLRTRSADRAAREAADRDASASSAATLAAPSRRRRWRERDLQAHDRHPGLERAAAWCKAISTRRRAARRSRPKPARSRSARSSASSATTRRSGARCRSHEYQRHAYPTAGMQDDSDGRRPPNALSRARSGRTRRADPIAPHAPTSSAPVPARAAAAGWCSMRPSAQAQALRRVRRARGLARRLSASRAARWR